MRALITGATGNVGRACAKLLLKQGWQVIGVARNREDLRMPDELIHTHCQFRHINLAKPYRTREDLAMLSLTFDLVIMAHGTQLPAELGSYGFVEAYNEVRASNLDSAVYLTDVLIDHNQLNPGALIVYCSSIQATQPRRGRGAYAIAKAGLEALCRIVAVEQAGKGVRTVAFRLGQLDSTMKGIVFDDRQLEAITDRLPLPLVKCENVARLILSLYEQSEMTGVVLDMDSGHHLNIWP